MKENKFNELIKPSLVLLIICLVVAAALAATYQVTEPIIEAINIKNANIARAVVLPQAEGAFAPIEADLPESVTEFFKAENGTGVVLTVLDKGFGGKLTVMIGIDDKEAITGVKVTKHTETPGLGTKAMTEEYLSQYIGQAAITRANEQGETQIDAVTGATITSDAVYRAAETALAQFKELGGAQ